MNKSEIQILLIHLTEQFDQHLRDFFNKFNRNFDEDILLINKFMLPEIKFDKPISPSIIPVRMLPHDFIAMFIKKKDLNMFEYLLD
jgi:hypothetical protein